MNTFVAVILNFLNALCLFGFVLITCGGKNNNTKSNNVPLVQQTPIPATTDQPTSTQASVQKDAVDKKQQPIPPSNVPVAAPKANDHTMREVESMKLEKSRE